MREINLAVWHCSATKEGVEFDIHDIDDWHRARGFRKVGYHIVILLDGSKQFGRAIWEIGAHAEGYNHNSIGICYIGGLDMDGKAKDTRTPAQRREMKTLKNYLDYMFPGIVHVGHRDLSVDLNGDGVITPEEWMKQCPSFDVKTEL
jgi:N-acetylmuramoyl-L-alanine amidase